MNKSNSKRKFLSPDKTSTACVSWYIDPSPKSDYLCWGEVRVQDGYKSMEFPVYDKNSVTIIRNLRDELTCFLEEYENKS